MIERGNKDLGVALHTPLIDSNGHKRDLVIPQILQSLRATPNSNTGEASNYLLLGKELRLPDTINRSQLPL